MYLSSDDAKSDVILAAAVLLFGNLAYAIVVQLPLYPRPGGTLAMLLDLAWLLVLSAAMPWWLSRYRGDKMGAFGLDGDRSALRSGVVLAIPIVIAQIMIGILDGRDLMGTLLGDIGLVVTSPFPQDGLITFAVGARFVVVTLGATLVVSFLAIRSREAFPRSPDTSLTELLRTFGMGAAGIALVVGLLQSLFGSLSAGEVLLNVGALIAVILMADRRLSHTAMVPRATLVAPAIIVLVVHIFASGGIFRGLAAGLYPGALGAGIAIVVGALVQLRGLAWSIVPLLIVVHWWSGPLSPLAF